MPKGLQGTPIKEACDEPFDVPLAGMEFDVPLAGMEFDVPLAGMDNSCYGSGL